MSKQIEFPGKPVASFITNHRANVAQASLKEILTTMSARIVESNNFILAIAGIGLDERGIVADSELSTALQQAIAIFSQNIRQNQDK